MSNKKKAARRVPVMPVGVELGRDGHFYQPHSAGGWARVSIGHYRKADGGGYRRCGPYVDEVKGGEDV